eukprot:COSAG01_NODE_171_length_23132_cov_53.865118_9_plen_67_part_00
MECRVQRGQQGSSTTVRVVQECSSRQCSSAPPPRQIEWSVVSLLTLDRVRPAQLYTSEILKSSGIF